MSQKEFLEGIYHQITRHNRYVRKRVIQILSIFVCCFGIVMFAILFSHLKYFKTSRIPARMAAAYDIKPSQGITEAISEAELIVTGIRRNEIFQVKECYYGQKFCNDTLRLNSTSQKMIPAQKQVILMLQENGDLVQLVDHPNHVLSYTQGAAEFSEYELSDGSSITVKEIEKMIQQEKSNKQE